MAGTEPIEPGTGYTQLRAGLPVGAGRYVLVRLLGIGGMGVVWLARDQKLRQDVALKFLPPQICADPVAVDELRQETARALRLTHSNIVRIFDLHEAADGEAFIAMEFVDGASLSALRSTRPNKAFSWEFLSPVVRQLCEALGHAHDMQIVHRDLKPSNLMLDSRGSLKLADFGIAASLSDCETRLTGRKTSGTLPYMSPQQVCGNQPAVTDDIYSLGITVYELLAGKPPFHSGDIAYQVMSVPPEPLLERMASRGIQSDLPPAVGEVIMACLAKDPVQRPQTSVVVQQWLDAAEAGIAPEVTTVDSSSARLGAAKRWWWLLAGAGLLAAAGAALMFWPKPHKGIDPAPSLPEANLYAPDYSWVATAGGADRDEARAVGVDEAGNCYVTGSFSGDQASFGSLTVSGQGRRDIFLAKYSPSGEALWVRSAGGFDDDEGLALSVDAAGNCFVAGTFRSSCQFASAKLIASSMFDAFLAKYDAAGAFQWVRQIKGGSFGTKPRPSGIATDASGHCYIVGDYGDPGLPASVLDLDGLLITNGFSGASIFLAKYDGAGKLTWAKHPWPGSVSSAGVAVDRDGTVVMSGHLWSDIRAPNATLSYGKNRGNVYLARFSPDGLLLRADSHGPRGYFNYAAPPAVLQGQTWLLDFTMAEKGLWEFPKLLLFHINQRGQTVWRQDIFGLFPHGGAGLAADSHGSVCLAATTSRNAQCAGTALNEVGRTDALLAVFDRRGSLRWIRRDGGPGNDGYNQVAGNRSGRYYAVGTFEHGATFGTNTLSSAGGRDIVVVQFPAAGRTPPQKP